MVVMVRMMLLMIMRINQQEVGVVSTTVLSIVYTCADVCKKLFFFVLHTSDMF